MKRTTQTPSMTPAVSSSSALSQRFSIISLRIQAAQKELDDAQDERNQLAKDIYEARGSKPFTVNGAIYTVMLRQNTKMGDDGQRVNTGESYIIKSLGSDAPEAL